MNITFGSAHTMTFGDWAQTAKGLPGIPLDSRVAITGVGMYQGNLCYSAAVYDEQTRKFTQLTKPYPTHAFTFLERCTADEQMALAVYINKNPKG